MGEEKEYKMIRVESLVAAELEMMRSFKKERSMNSFFCNITHAWMLEEECRPVSSAIERGIGYEDEFEDDETFNDLYAGLDNRGMEILVEYGSYEEDGDRPQFIICYTDEIIRSSPISPLTDNVLTKNYTDYPSYGFSFSSFIRPVIKITDNIKAKDLDFIKSFE